MLSAFKDTSEDGQQWLTVKCRLFQRGDGWQTFQSWAVLDEGRVLHERYRLQQPDKEDVVVDRFFYKLISQQDISEEATINEEKKEQDKTKLWACFALAALICGGVVIKTLNNLPSSDSALEKPCR